MEDAGETWLMWRGLSPEVVLYIWSFLPPKEVFLLAEVCKSWYEVLQHPTYPWKLVHSRFVFPLFPFVFALCL